MIDNKGSIRVWALFRYYYPNFAGAAIQGHQILSRLAGRGFSVRVLAAADQVAASMAGQTIEMDGLSIRYLPVVRSRNWFFLARIPLLRKLMSCLNGLVGSLSLNLRNAWVLWREGRRGDIVQLYSCNQFSFLVVWLAQVRGMHPVIRMTLMGSDDPASFQNGMKPVMGTLKLEAFRRAEAIVSISSALTNSCRSAGLDPDKVVQIPNGVDLQLFHPLSKPEQANLRAALGLRPDQRYIVFVGSALHRKGIDILTRAFIHVAQQISDIELLIVGPCDFSDHTRHHPERQQFVADLKQDLAQVGYSSRVHWVGEVDNVHEYLQVANAFCLPTRREGLGTVIVEALAVGLPVVTARLEGVTTDLIQLESEGVLIAGDDPNDYANALLQLLRDSTMAKDMGNCARVRAETEFSLELAVQRYAELYRGLAGVTKA